MSRAKALLTPLFDARDPRDVPAFAAGLRPYIQVRQYYTLREGLILRMDTQRLEEPSRSP